MRYLTAIALALVSASCATNGNEPVPVPNFAADLANVYDLEVDVSPSDKRLAASGTIQIVADGLTNEASFLLNRGLEVEIFQSSHPAVVSFEEGITIGNYEMPNTQRITLVFERPLMTGQRVEIDIAYAGMIRDDSIEWGRGLISPNWIELNQGSIWYPIWREEPLIRSRVTARLPEGYSVIGPGTVTKEADGRWIVDPGKAILGRITLAASPDYTVTTAQITPAMEARLYTLGDEPRAAALLAGVRSIHQYYTQLLGDPGVTTKTLTIAYANADVGVTRPQMAFATNGDYIALGVAEPEDQGFLLAHEIAHFWWILGAAGTPDEFMTESTAEYVAWRYGQTKWGDDWLEKKVDLAARVSASIEGSMFDEGDFEGRETLLYFRGPHRLWQLQNWIGIEAMDALLVEAHKRDVSELSAFVRLIEEREGSDIANWFKSQL